jgi:predicted molibdopterin-dependent oxidoreductase YjgC
MLRRKGERGFLRVTWQEVLDVVCKALRDPAPHELGFLAGTRGLTNEAYYVFQKLARTLGTNNVDLCLSADHSAGLSALKATLGHGAPTCSLSDFIGTDLLIIFGSDLTNRQPVMAKYLRAAMNAGTRILVVDPRRDYGAASEWPEDADFYPVRSGGDIAFINGVIKTLIANDQLDRAFIDRHTAAFGALKESLDAQSWEMIEQRSGLARADMQRFAVLYGQARTAVIVYGHGLTRHEFAAENVRAVINLALARGMVGREKCGLMPIRSASGAPGGNECGAAPDRFPGDFAVADESARRFSNLWHHPVPTKPGLTAAQKTEAAQSGALKFVYAISANLFAMGLDDHVIATALGKVPVRAHQSIALDRSMLLEPAETVVLLPAQTLYEQGGGGTMTSIERRIRFTPEIPGHEVGECLPDWEIAALIGRRSMPNGDKLFSFKASQAIREEMSRVMPIYQGIAKLTREGDQLQWGGPRLYADGFTAMPLNRALFSAVEPPELESQKSSEF